MWTDHERPINHTASPRGPARRTPPPRMPLSQQAAIPACISSLQCSPLSPLSPTRIVMLMIINVVMRVMRSESATRGEGGAEGGVICCVLPTNTPNRMERDRTPVVRCERVTSERCASFFFQGSKSFPSIVWLGAMTTTRGLLRSLYPADPSSCVTSSVCIKPMSRRVLWHAGALKPATGMAQWQL